jgi:drug/metabolite transporter (DMT)-like permease
MFLIVSICMTAAVFLACVRLHMPLEGRRFILLSNIWTAIGFLSAFFALKHLSPAMFASIEIGVSLFAAILLVAVQLRAWPRTIRILACIGIFAGCVVLARSEAPSTPEPADDLTWLAIVASIATGISSALTVYTSKQLARHGWTSADTLAHRFYLTIAASVVWLSRESVTPAAPPADTLVLIMVVGAVVVLIPLLLLQIALRSTDELTVMVCLAAQPILSFVISVPSPAYDWSFFTLLGVVIVTASVGLDVASQHSGAAARAHTSGGFRNEGTPASPAGR